jgi:hypothetical protein
MQYNAIKGRLSRALELGCIALGKPLKGHWWLFTVSGGRLMTVTWALSSGKLPSDEGGFQKPSVWGSHTKVCDGFLFSILICFSKRL